MGVRLGPGRFFGEAVAAGDAGTGLRVVASGYRAGTALPRHGHEHAHLCFVVSGSYAEQVGRRSFERAPLDLAWYPAEAEHAEQHVAAGRHLLVDVGADLAGLEEVLPAEPRSVRDPRAARAGLRLERAVRDPGACPELDLRALVAELLDAVRRAPRGCADDRRPPAWLRDVARELADRYTDPLRLADLARRAGVDEAHLARTWRRHRGETLGETQRRWRVLHVCRRLRGGVEASLCDLALEAGFADQSHMGRVFRRLVGTTPARFRREVRG